MSDKNTYHMVISALVDQFNQETFLDYCPSKVIDNFWVKYSGGAKDANVFDLLHQTAACKKSNRIDHGDLDDFVTDFAGFLMASYAVHYRRHEVCTYRCLLSDVEASEFRAFIDKNLVSKLKAVVPP